MILLVVYAGGGVVAGEFVSIGDQPTTVYAHKGVVVIAGVEKSGARLQRLNESLRSDQYVRLMRVGMVFVVKRDIPQNGHVRARNLSGRGHSLMFAPSQISYGSMANDTAIPFTDTGMPDAILGKN